MAEYLDKEGLTVLVEVLEDDLDIARTTANAAQKTADDAIPKSGGTFTGSVILDHDPVENMEIATKQYADGLKYIYDVTFRPSKEMLCLGDFEDIYTDPEEAFEQMIAGTITHYDDTDGITKLRDYALYCCSTVKTVSFPVCQTIGVSAFYSCAALTTASFPLCSSIGSSAFYNCSSLESLYVTGPSIPKLANASVFAGTPLSASSYLGRFGSIYVAESLLTNYRTASYWSAYSSRMVGV